MCGCGFVFVHEELCSGYLCDLVELLAYHACWVASCNEDAFECVEFCFEFVRVGDDAFVSEGL